MVTAPTATPCRADYESSQIGDTTVVSRQPLPDFDPRYCDLRLHEVMLQVPEGVVASVHQELDRMEAAGAPLATRALHVLPGLFESAPRSRQRRQALVERAACAWLHARCSASQCHTRSTPVACSAQRTAAPGTCRLPRKASASACRIQASRLPALGPVFLQGTRPRRCRARAV